MQFIESTDNLLRNILITISYDGKNYHGWQIQSNALTVQEVFQKAMKKILDKDFDIKGCSRTDAGVHANMYCISVKIDCKISCINFMRALNGVLPYDISVVDCKEVPMDFHARYSCKGKEYLYKIWNAQVRNPFMHGYALHYWHNLDDDKMREASKYYIGKHNFTSFCTLDKRRNVNMIRYVKNFEIKRDNHMLEFKVEADGFLYNMVRIMIGTLLRVSQNKIKPQDISYIIKAQDRNKAGPTSPPCGLYLNKVFYK